MPSELRRPFLPGRRPPRRAWGKTTKVARGRPAAGAFFDSAFINIDSLLAVALLHGLQGKTECRVAVVTISRPNLKVAGLVDVVERFYRGPAAVFAQVPPPGMITKGDEGTTSPAFTEPF